MIDLLVTASLVGSILGGQRVKLIFIILPPFVRLFFQSYRRSRDGTVCDSAISTTEQPLPPNPPEISPCLPPHPGLCGGLKRDGRAWYEMGRRKWPSACYPV